MIFKNTLRGVVAFIGLVALVGCAGPKEFSVTSLSVSPPSLMIAKKSPRTAYIVIDRTKIPDPLPVLVDGADRGGRITDVDTFVERDLTRVFSNYFDDVRVLRKGEQPGGQGHVLIDVKIDRVEVRVTSRREDGILTHTGGHGVMTWGLAMRPSEASEYLYSFAGESVGAPGETPDLVFRSMFESAIASMLAGFTEKNVHATLLALPDQQGSATATKSL